jgi:hypothetical protein
MAEETIELVGLDDLIRILAKAGAYAVPLLTYALTEEAHNGFRLSQVEVPFRFGILKGSGRVNGPRMEGGNIVVDISYGGAAGAYAYIMHRGTMHGRAINYRNGKKANYLSDPVRAMVPGMSNRLAAKVEEMFNE